MTQQLELNIVKIQNTELASRIQAYRQRNKILQAKNEELEVWVSSFAIALSSLEAAMRTFQQNEEVLYRLMRRSDQVEKGLLGKYTHHFKAFNDILFNLSEKLKDTQRSGQVAAEIKNRVEQHVKTYETFFRQFVDQYFRHHDQSLRWTSEMVANPDPRDSLRKLAMKSHQQLTKIKELQSFMEELRGQHPKLALENQKLLLSELLAREQAEVKRLTDLNINMSRKFRLMMDYNKASIEQQIKPNATDQCICGGSQLAYFKKEWETRLQKENESAHNGNGTANSGFVPSTEQTMILQSEIQELRRNNRSYLERYEKIKIQKNIQEAVIKSHAFRDLITQCQDLMRYCNQLQQKLKQSSDKMLEVERLRREELRQLKKKYEMEKLACPPLATHNINLKILGREVTEFKNHIAIILAPIKQSIDKSSRSEEHISHTLKENQNIIEMLKRDNEQLRRRLHELEVISKPPDIDFKHQAHRKLMKEIQGYLPKEESKIVERFYEFVKSREKKATHLQGELKKKEKELATKKAFEENLKKVLSDTELLYEQNKIKVEKMTTSLKQLQDEITQLVQQNVDLKSEFDNERTILNMRLKNEGQTNAKLQEKVRQLNNVVEETQASKHIYAHYKISQQNNYMTEIKNKQEALQLEHKNLLDECNIAKTKLLEFEKTEKRYIQDNELLRTKLNAIRRTELKKEQFVTNEDEMEMMQLELRNLRNKLYCSCKNDRQIEVSLKTCPHMFCKKCIDEVMGSRARCCPLCKTKFSKGDINQIKWN